jgi:hypothetical protein
MCLRVMLNLHMYSSRATGQHNNDQTWCSCCTCCSCCCKVHTGVECGAATLLGALRCVCNQSQQDCAWSPTSAFATTYRCLFLLMDSKLRFFQRLSRMRAWSNLGTANTHADNPVSRPPPHTQASTPAATTTAQMQPSFVSSAVAASPVSTTDPARVERGPGKSFR